VSNKKFNSGAFVFFTKRNVRPVEIDYIKQSLVDYPDLDESIIPPYAGDRMAVFRTLRTMIRKVAHEGWLCRPIKRDKKEVVYGIVKEKKDEIAETLDHDHEATFAWRATHPHQIFGNHEVSVAINDEYQSLRDKIHGDDWTRTVVKYLVNGCSAQNIREEGIVYWVPPQMIKKVGRLNDFLTKFGVRVTCCEIESADVPMVQEVVQSNLDEELEKFEEEVNKFDGKQRSTVYTIRLQRYEELRKRANLYKSALGVAVDRISTSLDELESKVTTMLDLRSNLVVHKDGSATQRDEPKKLLGNKKLAAANGNCEHDDVDENGMCLICLQEVC